MLIIFTGLADLGLICYVSEECSVSSVGFHAEPAARRDKHTRHTRHQNHTARNETNVQQSQVVVKNTTSPPDHTTLNCY
jgi:hypothetical protein